MKSVGAAEFKTHCLRILDEVQATGEPVTITKRGKPVAEIGPSAGSRKPLVFGMMRTPAYHFDLDPSEPAFDGLWDAEKPEAWDEYL